MKHTFIVRAHVVATAFAVVGFFAPPVLAQQSIDDIRAQYRSSLETYRTDEREYQRAKDQFFKVQTLTSLESAVQATRTILLARADILILYLQQVSVALAEVEGLTDAQRATALDEVQTSINSLRTHRNKTEQAITRAALNGVVADFSAVGEGVKSVSFRSQTLLAYGKIRAAYGQVLAARVDVEVDLLARNLNGLELGEKQRALSELDQAIATTTTRMDRLTTQIFPAPGQTARTTAARPQGYSQATYTQTVTQLSQIYGELLRIVEYLREVAQ